MNPLAVALPLALAVAAVTTGAAIEARPRAPAVVVAPGPASFVPDRPSVPRVDDAPRDAAAVPRTSPAVTGALAPRDRWAWPLRPRPAVVRPFVPPPTPYAAGHRGVDLAASAGQVVRAVDAGTVTHVGPVAGRGSVTVTHVSGVRSTYEPVVPWVRGGAVVPRGGVIGTVAAGTSHCAPATCLHLGAVRRRDYLDPMRLLGGGRVRLLPLHRAPDGQAPDG